jgi:hypothetical protein
VELKVDAEKLAKEIDKTFRQMRFHPMFLEEKFAIFQRNKIQVQVVLTKEKEVFCDEIQDGIMSLEL